MVLIKTTTGWSSPRGLPGDPVYFTVNRSRIASARTERVKRIWPTFPPVTTHFESGFEYRLAVLSDLDPIVELVDRLLSGRDFFCPRGQHIGYLKYKTILLALTSKRLVGWAVRQKNGSLIHLLVEPEFRGCGIGSHLLKVLQPLFVRSKSDQSTGDPYPFYAKHGYEKTTEERIGKNKTIDLLSKTPSSGCSDCHAAAPSTCSQCSILTKQPPVVN